VIKSDVKRRTVEDERRRPRVMLVDDHRAILTAVGRLLGATCDIVDQIDQGVLAVAAAARVKPDLVVLDVSMPDVSGLDLCRQLLDAVPTTRIVILTGLNDGDIEQEAYARGASAFVTKVNMGERLVATVQRVFVEAAFGFNAKPAVPPVHEDPA
jgi:DNA-binding NarL/FixJ family response regulator